MRSRLPTGLSSSSARWASPEFRDEVETWVRGAVGAVRALEQVKLRPWSTVWRADTDAGVFFAKQNCPGQDFEAALVAELAALAPLRVVPVSAVDNSRGLLLTPDQGEVLGVRDDVTDPPVWRALLVAAAQLQRDVVPHIDDLVARLGLTVMRPQDAGEYVAARVETLASLPERDPRRLGAEVAGELHAMAPTIQGWGDQVAALGLPLTINHNDLHAHNAFMTASGLCFFDFGDAVVADPLAVLRVPVNVLTDHLDAPVDDVRVRDVAEAALEVWSDLVPMGELRAALPAALRLGRLGRVESWLRCTPSMDAAELADFGGHAAAWLGSLTEDPWR
jgi:Phosphotransferase enzyme family